MFGSDAKNISFTKLQNSQATLTKSRDCIIFTPVHQFTTRKNDPSPLDPAPGQYNGSIITDYSKINCAGQGVSINTTGRKPLWKADQNTLVGPGMYKNQKADKVTKPRVTGGNINRKPEAIWHRPLDSGPDPCSY